MGALTFPPGGSLGCGQQERDTEAAAEPERRHGRASLRRWGCLLGAESVPSFFLDQVFYRLFYLTQS